MIGTTSDMESYANVLYPSITMCSRTKSDVLRTSNNMSTIHQRSWNLSNTFISLELHVRNGNGMVERIYIRPQDGDTENKYTFNIFLFAMVIQMTPILTIALHFCRDIINGHFALYPGPININGSGMMVIQLQICHKFKS